MKSKYFFLLLVFQLNQCIGQEAEKEVPYFVMACAEVTQYQNPYRIESVPFYYKFLLRLDKKKLITIDTLNSVNNPNIVLSNILQIEDQKLFYFEECNKFHKGKRRFISFLDYNKGFKLRRFDAKLDTSYNWDYLIAHCFLIDSILVIENEFDIRTGHFGRDKYFNKYQLKEDSSYKFYAEGKTGMHRAHDNSNIMVIHKKDHDPFRIRDTIDLSLYPIPDSMLDAKLYYVSSLNNRNYIVFEPMDMNDFTDHNSCKVIIVNKRTKTSKTVDLPTSILRIKNYENWFYGTTTFPYNGSVKIVSGKTQAKKYASRYYAAYGDGADLSLYPGQLYLYNFSTQDIIKWSTGDPDSEILTINNGIIYYRVFNKIYSVELDSVKNKIDWHTKKLLVKDKKLVPNIHWMFFAPKQDKLEEVWVNRPQNK